MGGTHRHTKHDSPRCSDCGHRQSEHRVSPSRTNGLPPTNPNFRIADGHRGCHRMRLNPLPLVTVRQRDGKQFEHSAAAIGRCDCTKENFK
jgi:hypothetical protein